MRIDKTLSELWDLRACHSCDSLDELKKQASDTAFLAINTMKRLQDKINKNEGVDKMIKVEDYESFKEMRDKIGWVIVNVRDETEAIHNVARILDEYKHIKS